MAFLKLSDVYATLHGMLRNDPEIRKLMGFDDTTTMVEMAKRIQKRRVPVEVIEESQLPMVTFYKLPGHREPTNYLSYVTMFDFDIYTENDVEVALDIADRISELLNEQYLPMCKGSSLKCRYVTSAEDKSGAKDVYKYYVEIALNLIMEG